MDFGSVPVEHTIAGQHIVHHYAGGTLLLLGPAPEHAKFYALEPVVSRVPRYGCVVRVLIASRELCN